MLRKAPVLVLLVILLALFASVASAQGGPLTVNLAAQNNSGQNGTATLTAKGDQTEVVINLPVGPAGAGVDQPVHIHEGACPTPGRVVFPLTSLKEGKSTTMVNAKLADIANGKHAINAHKSAAEASVYTSCGNVQQIAQAAGAPAALPTTGADSAMLWMIAAFGLVLALGGLVLRRAR
jgi:LPXTG-motif cell wall-anchored protein